ncbi:hypothetical protein WJX72_005370 [[Myrmecia] bisecta]|uniref:Mitochondrial import inner membrane translocase subunit TIM23 n=1 Tax=[Myrmecia] bisecta TaxID=41462 RepID=A0AAW1PT51_9CHLO
MGFLDRFRRESPQQQEAAQPVSLPSGSELLSEASTSDLLRGHSGGDLSSLPGQPSFAATLDSERVYNPYEGINNAIAGQSGKFVYKLPKQPEFLFSEEATVHKRSWSENLTYYTGTGYLSGAILGGASGAVTAMRSSPQLDVAPTARLRLNRLLNVSGRSGRQAGNALGVLGLFFSTMESTLGHFSDGTVPDEFNSIGAGFLTGSIFRSTRGPRAAAIAGAVGAAAAAGLVAARNTVSKSL